MSADVNTAALRPRPPITVPADADAPIGDLPAGLAEAELGHALAELIAYHDRLQAALSELDRT